MKKHKFIIVVNLFIAILFALLSLPSFRIESGNLVLENKSLLSQAIGQDIGRFKLDKDITGSTEYKIKLAYLEEETFLQKEETAKKLLEQINTRINYSGLYSITAKLVNQKSDYYIVLDVPKFFQDQSDITELLVAPGVVSFYVLNNSATEDNAPSVIPLDISDSNIVGSIRIDYSSATVSGGGSKIGNYFVFNMDDIAINQLSSFFRSSSNLLLVMTIDQNQFLLTPFDSNPEQALTNPNGIRAFLNSEFSSENQKITKLSILRSYFANTTPLLLDLDFDTAEISNIEGDLRPANVFYLLFVFAIFLGIFLLYIFRYFGLRFFIFAIIYIGYGVFGGIALLRLFGANISNYTLIGLLFFLLIVFRIFISYVKLLCSEESRENKIKFIKVHSMIYLILFISCAIGYSISFSQVFIDFISTIFLCSLIFYIFSSLILKSLIFNLERLK